MLTLILTTFSALAVLACGMYLCMRRGMIIPAIACAVAFWAVVAVAVWRALVLTGVIG